MTTQRKGAAATDPNPNSTNCLSSLYNSHAEFLNAIRNAGIPIAEPDRIIANGDICRFHVDGDKRATRNGWATLHVDDGGAAGAFGHWRSTITGTWRGNQTKSTPEQRDRLRAAVKAATAQREAERALVAKEAQKRAYRLWDSASSADPKHAYLQRKQINPYDLRQRGNLLLIPLFDVDGVLHSLQFIDAAGNKKFLSGGAKRGHFHQINQIVDRVNIVEGLATGMSVYQATGTAVVVAFDAGNLLSVAKAIRLKYPHAAICLCADNDLQTPGNPGLTAAHAAAAAVGGRVAIPPYGCCDFNDAALLAEVTP